MSNVLPTQTFENKLINLTPRIIVLLISAIFPNNFKCCAGNIIFLILQPWFEQMILLLFRKQLLILYNYESFKKKKMKNKYNIPALLDFWKSVWQNLRTKANFQQLIYNLKQTVIFYISLFILFLSMRNVKTDMGL